MAALEQAPSNLLVVGFTDGQSAQSLAAYSQGRVLTHTLPPEVAAHVAPLFQG